MASLIPENSAGIFRWRRRRASPRVRCTGADARCVGVTTDSRGDLRGKLFVALRGERFDGRREFVQSSRLKLGAERRTGRASGSGSTGRRGRRLASTLSALGALAGEHRKRWGNRIVAVAGSAKQDHGAAGAISAVLTAISPTAPHFAAGNLNNLIGVLDGVARLEVGARAGESAELGTNAPGEVRALSLMAAPELAVLTLIGIEHSEGLGDLDDGVEREEGQIYWSGLGAAGVCRLQRR